MAGYDILDVFKRGGYEIILKTDSIRFYEGPHYMFSNFSAFAVEWRGQRWMTAEHAYQAAKFVQGEIQRQIWSAPSAYDAKTIARTNDSLKRSDWESTKLDIMEEILYAKLEQHPYIQEKLLATGDRNIIEDSPSDSFWGRGPDHTGLNHLGKLWMKLRGDLCIARQINML